MKDCQRKEIQIGDYIAYASCNGMRMGRVHKIVQKLRYDTVQTSISLRLSGKTIFGFYSTYVCLQRPDKALVVPFTMVAPDVQAAFSQR